MALLDGDRFQSVTNQIAALPIPTIAVLTGNVFGGGAELALSCDFRLAREGIVLRIPAAAIGLCYPVEGIERLTRRLGPGWPGRVLVAAETFQAEQMLLLQIWSMRCTPRTRCGQAAGEYAQVTIGAGADGRGQYAGDHPPVGGRVTWIEDHARTLAEACSDSEDVQEGITAQREKRARRASKISDPDSPLRRLC